MISSLARFKTLLSTVSTEVAFASTRKGEFLNAESKLSYFILMSVLNGAMGVMLSFASVTIASEPSLPVIILDKSKVVSSSLKTFSKS